MIDNTKRRERAIRKQLKGALEKEARKLYDRQHAVSFFLEDSTAGDAIVRGTALTADEYGRIHDVLSERYGQKVVIVGIVELARAQPDHKVELPTPVRQAIEQIILDAERGDLPEPRICREVADWLKGAKAQ